MRVAVAISPRATSPADTEPMKIVARLVDSVIAAVRAPCRVKCSVVTNATALGRGAAPPAPVLASWSLLVVSPAFGPVAWLVMESGSCNDLDGEDRGDEPVDGGAKRRPPPGIGNVVAAFLPEVFETMGGVAKDEEPGRPGDACGGKQDEGASDGALDGDHLGSSVGHREPDVDRCDQG